MSIFESTLDPIAKLLGEWAKDVTLGSVLLRVLLSILFAAIIGCERSSKRHAAGLRTFLVVSLGATVAALVDLSLFMQLPLITAATVVGVAIITVNSILYSSKNQIRGLTTSVSLFAVGILGAAIGAGMYTMSCTVFLILVLSLSLFPRLEAFLKDRSNHFEMHIELKNPAFLRDFVTTVRKLGLRIDDIEQNPAYAGSGLSVYSVAVTIDSAELKKLKSHKEVIEALATLDFVYHIEELR